MRNDSPTSEDSSPEAVPSVTAADVEKSYWRNGTRLHVLHEVNLTIHRGEFVALVGASGSGKTTLLRLIGGGEPPDSGRVMVEGTDTGSLTETSTVFQSDSLLPWRTVLRNIEFGLEAQPAVKQEARRRRAKGLCSMVGLAGFEDYYPYEISGGMRQRVNLARALAVDPLVLLMDEPFAALDAQTREIMQQELLKIWQQDQKTVLFVTHQMDEALYLADRVVVLRSRPGRIADEIHVPFPRPRSLDIKRTKEFADLEAQVWANIESDVRAGMVGLDPST